jgi:hypothetical protein
MAGPPDFDCTNAMSLELTARFAVVSPASTPMGTETFPVFTPSCPYRIASLEQVT